MHSLDNVTWRALNTRQAEFAQSSGQARSFVPEVSVLAGVFEPTARGYESLAKLLADGRTVTLALEAPYQPRPGLSLVASGPAFQMICEGDETENSTSSPSDPEITELGASDVQEMMELTARTKPGPFSKRTHELGTYLGIRRDGRLIAMAGERLKVPGYTEVSAVCTHPEHLGHGYARVLMTEVMRRIRHRGETPFLHVRQANRRAIELYERLGYSVRVPLQMTVLRKE